VVRRVHDCMRQSVVERRRGREGSCTSTVQHQRLVDGAESVNFMISTLESDLQLILDSLEIFDVAGCAVKERDFASLLIRRWEGFLEAGIPFPELVASALLGLDALLANSFAARVTRGRVVVSSNGSRFEFLVVVVIGIVVAPARPCTLVGSRASAGPIGGHSNRVEAVRAWDSSSIRDGRR